MTFEPQPYYAHPVVSKNISLTLHVLVIVNITYMSKNKKQTPTMHSGKLVSTKRRREHET